MKLLKSLFLLTFFTVITFFAPITDAFACRCAPTSFNYRWSQSDEVFIGRVKEIKYLYKYSRTSYEDTPVKVIFDIRKNLKEKPVSTESVEEGSKVQEEKKSKSDNEKEDGLFTLHTSIQKLTCMGFPFEKNEEYLVYAYMRTVDKAEAWSLYNYPSETYGVGGLCGGTKKFKNSKEEIERIKEKMGNDTKAVILKEEKEKK